MYICHGSPPHCVKDHVAELEKENEALRQSLTHAQEAFDIVSTVCDWCCENTQTVGWTIAQVERMREINEIIRRALKVRDLCPRLVESERNAMHIKIEDLERQLVRERSGRLASEKKLSQYLRDRRKCKDSCTPKVPNQ